MKIIEHSINLRFSLVVNKNPILLQVVLWQITSTALVVMIFYKEVKEAIIWKAVPAAIF